MADVWLSTGGVSRALKVNRQTVRNWAMSGLLPGWRDRQRRWWFAPADVDDMVPPSRQPRPERVVWPCWVHGCDRPRHALERCKRHYQQEARRLRRLRTVSVRRIDLEDTNEL